MDSSDYEEYVAHGIYWPVSIGGLRCSLERGTKVSPSSNTAELNSLQHERPSPGVLHASRIAPVPNDFEASTSALGLRLRLQDGREVVTAVTHAFVKKNHVPLPTTIHPTHLIHQLKFSLAQTRIVGYLTRQPAVVWCINKFHDVNPIGKEIYLGRTSSLVSYTTMIPNLLRRLY